MNPIDVHTKSPFLALVLACVSCTPQKNVAGHETAGLAAPVPEPARELERGCGLPVDIREPDWPRLLVPTVKGPPPLPAEDTDTIAVIPDTQYYVSCRDPYFHQQTAWLKGQLQARNVRTVIHLGDITEHNTEEEWLFAKEALTPLRGSVPLVLATGNHDYGIDGSADIRTTFFQRFLTPIDPTTQKVLVESMRSGDPENAYFRVPFRKAHLGILLLEWSPRTATVRWAQSILKKYATDRLIFVTHAYLFHDGTRYDFEKHGDLQKWNPRSYGTALRDPKQLPSPDNWHPDGAYDGEMLWNELLVDHAGLFLTLNGHVLGDGAAVLSNRGSHGNLVHQVLANYQMLDDGGQGFLRLIEFAASGKEMSMQTYSPSLDQTATGEDQRFTLPLDPPLP